MVYFYRFDSLFTLKRCYYKKIQSTQGVTTNINEKQERLYIYIYIYIYIYMVEIFILFLWVWMRFFLSSLYLSLLWSCVYKTTISD
jgi:glucan phosphoethanolaminetransferase (alkaline phosphatase superfamily)